MKTIKLDKSIFYLGRIRAKGEVIPVSDGFSQGEDIAQKIEVKNKQAVASFIKDDKLKQSIKPAKI